MRRQWPEWPVVQAILIPLGRLITFRLQRGHQCRGRWLMMDLLIGRMDRNGEGRSTEMPDGRLEIMPSMTRSIRPNRKAIHTVSTTNHSFANEIPQCSANQVGSRQSNQKGSCATARIELFRQVLWPTTVTDSGARTC